MAEDPKQFCPECESTDALDRRSFFRQVGKHTAAAVALGSVAGSLPRLRADEKPAKTEEKPAKPAEDWIRELVGSLSDEQKKTVILPWDHGADKGKLATRLALDPNSALLGKKIGANYTKPQQEIIERIVKAISAGEEGYTKISRNGTWDGSGSLQNCGALMFGELAKDKRFAFVYTGHHLTVRCPGTSEEGAAFGGPMYYGHSPGGYSEKNVFNYQTKSVMSLFEALTEGQRKVAVAPGNPGEHMPSVRFRAKDQPKPGISHGELNKDQQKLVETVMRDLLSPFRKEDGDEVMKILKTNGGLEKIHLAFYKDAGGNEKQPWSFWRLEGPGFVWNYRVLPHVHTFVHIAPVKA
jgi:hypothetical protein